MYLVGLTGGIATGKSMVSRIFSDSGIPVIDADLIAREAVKPGKPAYRKLRKHFGDEYFDAETGELLRKKLGDLIFSQPEARHVVNSITHPEIRKAILFRVLQHFFRGENYVVLDLPLLFESGYAKILQKIILVDCPEDLQIQRLCERDGIDEEAARARIQAQYPMAVKRRQATHIVDNGGTVQETRAQVHALIEELNKSRLHLLIKAGVLLALLAFLGFAGSLLYSFSAATLR